MNRDYAQELRDWSDLVASDDMLSCETVDKLDEIFYSIYSDRITDDDELYELAVRDSRDLFLLNMEPGLKRHTSMAHNLGEWARKRLDMPLEYDYRKDDNEDFDLAFFRELAYRAARFIESKNKEQPSTKGAIKNEGDRLFPLMPEDLVIINYCYVLRKIPELVAELEIHECKTFSKGDKFVRGRVKALIENGFLTKNGKRNSGLIRTGKKTPEENR